MKRRIKARSITEPWDVSQDMPPEPVRLYIVKHRRRTPKAVTRLEIDRITLDDADLRLLASLEELESRQPSDQEKDERIKELEALVASLQAQLRTARNTLEQYQAQARRQYRHDADYLDYEDDRR